MKSWHVKSYVLTKFFQKVIYPTYELLMTYFHEKQIPNCHEFFRQERNLAGKKNMQLCTLKNLWNGMFKSCLYKRRFSLTCGSLGLFWFYFGQCTNNDQCSAVNNCVHIVVHTTYLTQTGWLTIDCNWIASTYVLTSFSKK